MNTNVYVTNLDYTVTEEELKELFLPFGATGAVRIVRDENGRKVPSGAAIVYLPTNEAQENAILKMNGKMYKNRTLRVKKSTSTYFANQKEYSKTTVKVNYLHDNIGQEELMIMFQKYKPIKSFVHYYEINNGQRKSRGSGWVELANEQMQQLAIEEMNNTEHYGRRITVKAKPLNINYANEVNQNEISSEIDTNQIQSDISQDMNTIDQYQQMKQETEISEPQKETVQFNISQYYNNETVQIQVNNQTYSIQLSPDIRPRQQLLLKNGGTPINGNVRDLILVLDYDNENGTYLINGDDVYQYIMFDKQYEGETTRFTLTTLFSKGLEITININEGNYITCEGLGLNKTDGSRGNYFIIVKLQ